MVTQGWTGNRPENAAAMKTRLLTPGPTPLPESVRLTLAMDMVHHRKEGFTKVLQSVQKDLRWLFATDQPVVPLTCSGSGVMDAAVTNLFAPGEKVLVINAGKFGERWGKIALNHGLDVMELSVPWGQAVTLDKVKAALANHPGCKGILIQASETSTGVLHPIREIAAYTRNTDIMLVADGISAVGISPCYMDEWGLDCLLTGSQKGLMLPPGLAFLAFSARAWDRVAQVKPRNFYFNLLGEKAKIEKNCQTNFTPAINLIMGLSTSLAMFRERGLEDVFRTQWAFTQMVRTGAEAMGLELFAKENYTWGLTSIKMPAGVDGEAVLKACTQRYGVVMAGGQDDLKGKIIRMGHMGYVDFADVLAGLYALQSGLTLAGGHCGSDDYLERAMKAYETALEQGAPSL